MNIKDLVTLVKEDSFKMAVTDLDRRNNALSNIIKALNENKESILSANEQDIKNAYENNVSPHIIKRLKFDSEKLEQTINGLKGLILLEESINKTVFKRQLDDGLVLVKETCPIGVIGVIFEARPDALVQIASLCIKSANCAILKGGSETANTNRALFDVIHNACIKAGIPQNVLMLIEAREDIHKLLSCHGLIDLLIPRGSNSFVKYIMDNTNIPVMGHADGICHIYVDELADLKKAVKIIIDAKTQYPVACNAVETVLIHKNILEAIAPMLKEAFKCNNIRVRAKQPIYDLVDSIEDEKNLYIEHMDTVLVLKSVDNIEQAIEHINKYGSHHTDCIITENNTAAEKFMKYVDSAGVYKNCSTRFADGFRYGFGAEVGISTSKLHARGPVGLEGLCTYKYKLFGDGDIVADYAAGIKSFKFKDINM